MSDAGFSQLAKYVSRSVAMEKQYQEALREAKRFAPQRELLDQINLAAEQSRDMFRAERVATGQMPKIQSPAELVCESLYEAISDFNSSLDNSQEVGLLLATFGERAVFRVDSIEYRAPHLVVLHGRNDAGERLRLIQHASQVNCLLVAQTRLQPATPKPPIGFHYVAPSTSECTECHAPPVAPGPADAAETS